MYHCSLFKRSHYVWKICFQKISRVQLILYEQRAGSNVFVNHHNINAHLMEPGQPVSGWGEITGDWCWVGSLLAALSLSLHTIETTGDRLLWKTSCFLLLHEYKEASIVEIRDGFAELMMAIMNGDDDCTVYYWNLHYIKCNNIEEYKMCFFRKWMSGCNEAVSWPVTIPCGIITTSLFLSFFNF